MADGAPGRPRTPIERKRVKYSVAVAPDVFGTIDVIARRQRITIHALMSRVLERVFRQYKNTVPGGVVYPTGQEPPQGSTLSVVLSESPSSRALSDRALSSPGSVAASRRASSGAVLDTDRCGSPPQNTPTGVRTSA